MYYELYIDVFFLVNFMMDCILLEIVRKVLKCPATHGSICAGAILGSLLTCAVIVVPGLNAPVRFILFHGIVNIVMMKTGLRLRWDRTFLKAYILLYICAFLVGGIMEFFYPYVKAASLFFALALAGYYGSLKIWDFLSYLAAQRVGRCTVWLVNGEKSCSAEALIDTGNRLRDIVTGKPVSMVSPGLAERLGFQIPENSVKPAENRRGIRFIPYHSVGKKEGVMPVMIPDEMRIFTRREICIVRPVIAVCEEEMSMDEYEMLLNPDLL